MNLCCKSSRSVVGSFLLSGFINSIKYKQQCLKMSTLQLLLKLTCGNEAVPKTKELVTFQRPFYVNLLLCIPFHKTALHELRTVVPFNRQLVIFSVRESENLSLSRSFHKHSNSPYHSTTGMLLKRINSKIDISCLIFKFFQFYKEPFFH